ELSRGAQALRTLFADGPRRSRVDLKIRDCDPTNPQSEVLCFDPIPGEYFQFIHVNSYETHDFVLQQRGRSKIDVFLDERYFRPRSDWRWWSASTSAPTVAPRRPPEESARTTPAFKAVELGPAQSKEYIADGGLSLTRSLAIARDQPCSGEG